MSEATNSSMPRRGLILGAGAATLLATGVAGAPGAAAARAGEPTPSAAGDPSRTPAATRRTEGSPIASTLGSPPISGYTYRHVSMFDFTPESWTAGRAWGGLGVFAAGTNLWASVDIPAGARIRDIEWYVHNESGIAALGMGRLWAAGSGQMNSAVADVSIPSGSGITRTRAVVPSSSEGPYPLGCKLNLALYTGTSATQINGARVGFQQGAGATGLLPAPIRAYDSRLTGGKLTAGSTRTITLPTSAVAPGTAGVLLNITAHTASGAGYLKVYPGNAAAPTASALNFASGLSIANAMTVGVSSSRQIKIYTSQAVHIIVDVSGTVG